jgi:hypothetical protein
MVVTSRQDHDAREGLGDWDDWSIAFDRLRGLSLLPL